MLKLIALTDQHPQRTYFVNRINELFDISAVFVINQSKSYELSEYMRLLFRSPRNILGRASTIINNLLMRTLDTSETRKRELYDKILGSSWQKIEINNVIRIDKEHLNTESTAKQIRRFSPDIILVRSTPILNSIVFGEAKKFCLNFHKGLIPYYRGTSCLYWPIYQGQYDLLGVTIHQINEQTDAGAIANQAQYVLEPGDTFSSIEVKTTKLGTDLMIKTLKQIENGTVKWTEPELSKGKVYYSKEFTYGIKRQVINRLKMKGISTPQLREE
ncbi:formyltransferase family protein [Chloroflexota bacterium]